MAEENKVVELLGINKEVIQPYFDITLQGSISGYDHMHKDGHLIIDTSLSGKTTLTGFTEGEGSFDEEGNIVIETVPGEWRETMFGDWIGAVTQQGKVLNIFRRV